MFYLISCWSLYLLFSTPFSSIIPDSSSLPKIPIFSSWLAIFSWKISIPLSKNVIFILQVNYLFHFLCFSNVDSSFVFFLLFCQHPSQDYKIFLMILFKIRKLLLLDSLNAFSKNSLNSGRTLIFKFFL